MFGYLFILTGVYFLVIALVRYRQNTHVRTIGHTAAALAFIVGGVGKVYGVEQSTPVVVVFLVLFTVSLSAYFSSSE